MEIIILSSMISIAVAATLILIVAGLARLCESGVMGQIITVLTAGCLTIFAVIFLCGGIGVLFWKP